MNVYLNGKLARMPVIYSDVLLTPKKKATLPLASTLFYFISNIAVCIFLLRECEQSNSLTTTRGWSGGAIVLGKLPVSGRPTIWITVGQGPIALAEGAGGGCLDIFTLIYPFSSLSPSLWETARYRLKYCLKGPLNPKHQSNYYDKVLAYVRRI